MVICEEKVLSKKLPDKSRSLPSVVQYKKPMLKMSLRRTRSDSTKSAERSRIPAAVVIIVESDSEMNANDTSGSSDAMAPPTAKQQRGTSSTDITTAVPTQLRQHQRTLPRIHRTEHNPMDATRSTTHWRRPQTPTAGRELTLKNNVFQMRYILE